MMKQKGKTEFNFVMLSVKEKGLQVGKCKIKASMNKMMSKSHEEIYIFPSRWTELCNTTFQTKGDALADTPRWKGTGRPGRRKMPF